MISPDSRRMLLESLWRQPGKQAYATMLDELWALSRQIARSLGARDPDSDAAEAFCHLVEQLPQQIESFRTADNGWDVTYVRRWSRRVLKNQVLKLITRVDVVRTVYPGDDQLFDQYQQGVELEVAASRAWPSDSDELLLERDRLQLLLMLILRLRPSRRDLVLGRLSGFSDKQLAVHLPYDVRSIPVQWFRILQDLEGEGDRAARPSVLRFEHPQKDAPLAGRDVPRLTHALRHLTEPPGTGLLGATRTLEIDLYLPFFARLAGFWDCVIAGVVQLALDVQRDRFRRGRSSVEQQLTASDDRHPHYPADGPRKKGAGAMPRSTEGDGPPKRDGQRPALKGDGLHPAPKYDGLEKKDGWKRLLDTAEAEPDSAVATLLRDPLVHRGIARGRVAARSEAAAAPEEARSLGERLWTRAVEALEEATLWLQRPLLAPMVFRGEPGGADPGASGVVLEFGAFVESRPAAHCLVWQRDGDTLRLVYPVLPGDPTLGRALVNRRFVLRPVREGEAAKCIVAWVDELPARWQNHPKRHEAEIRAWLLERLSDEGDSFVTIHAGIFPPL